MRAVLAEELQLGEVRYRVAASVGIKLFLDDDEGLERILRAADAEMYKEKKRVAG